MVLVCVVKNCRNAKSTTKEKNCNLFRVPKDLDRSKEWLINCGREELCSKSVETLYNNYRVCMNHFKKNMFSNPEKTRLMFSAVPTEFEMHTTITTTSISVDVSTVVDEQINLSSPSTFRDYNINHISCVFTSITHSHIMTQQNPLCPWLLT